MDVRVKINDKKLKKVSLKSRDLNFKLVDHYNDYCGRMTMHSRT